MYFKDRTAAGKELAFHLAKYRDDDAIVATLTESSVDIAKIIASELRLELTTLITRAIKLPGESMNYGALDQEGHLTTNAKLTEPEVEEYDGEYHNYLEAEKINKTHDINVEVTKHGLHSRKQFSDKIVILVCDGLDDTVVLDSAYEYLKPIRLKRLVMAIPVASVSAVDRMHIGSDEIHCLSVTENYISADHYYDDTRPK